ncbi:numod4 motif family protein [Vibrio crassostreae]|uniref:HNH endonuclease n=1 Tax=Vibrio crassostreae TaxID=246167 RepID=UPI002009E47F|nr:HNH endonuclease [Vibrio crassostreae]UPR29372.1 numod4 motif family protein [Vibrio crassostreae]
MKRFKNGIGKHKGKNITLVEYDGQPALRVGLTKRGGKAKKKNIVTYISLCDIGVFDEHNFHAHKRSDGKYVAKCSITNEYLHRIIMQPDCDQEIDHVDADPLNNVRGNLRPCTTRQNNLAKKQDKVKGFYGIYHSPRGCYQAIDSAGQKHGNFRAAEEAAIERDDMMMSDYFHSDAGEDLHTYGFIHWNYPEDVYNTYEDKLMESSAFLMIEAREAIKASQAMVKLNGWKCD